MKKLILILLLSPLFSRAQDTLKNYCEGCTVQEGQAIVDSICKIADYKLIEKRLTDVSTFYYLKNDIDSLRIGFSGTGSHFNYLGEVSCSNKQTLLKIYVEIFGRDIKLMNIKVVDGDGKLLQSTAKDVWDNVTWKGKKYRIVFGILSGYGRAISF